MRGGGGGAILWKEHIDKSKSNSNSTASTSSEPSSQAPTADQPASGEPPASDPNSDLMHSASRRTKLTPRFSDTDTRAAPTAGLSTEQILKKFKHKVMTIYKNHKTSEHNHEPDDVRLLKDLSEDPDVMVKRSDKCKGLVVLSNEEYVHKAEKITDEYETIAKNPTPKLEAETKRLIKHTLKEKVPEKIVRSILPSGSRTAELYGLPKTHKPDAPLRPIVSACGDPLDKLTWFLE